eukprot:CAMPEP_0113484590 /NCGR_PEP_ID=MMETSP0014_2-20120614/24039_1 /TAXON_ID=2857 /ORGANISM="Nitzschia sp." /LENGTH=219 /DNA_ID=CAMNT_0000378195 /DNA_START=165 /DNA_END=820 /DNA_ORIENTATION=- /assembly_acc=CAM_ASM_000159
MMMKSTIATALVLMAVVVDVHVVSAFAPPRPAATVTGLVSTRSPSSSIYGNSEDINECGHGVGDGVSDRRSFVSNGLMVTAATAAATVLAPASPAYASGGATAGGAYLLSAKQRYNERVKTSVKGLLQAEESLKSGDSKSAKAYFDGEDAGSWKDLTAAGYLLSNAFRRTASKAPDSLPSVKKYKAFAAEVESLQKTLKKKGAQAAADQFGTVETALNV